MAAARDRSALATILCQWAGPPIGVAGAGSHTPLRAKMTGAKLNVLAATFFTLHIDSKPMIREYKCLKPVSPSET